MVLLFSELVELEQGEGLFDIESGLGLIHQFLPSVGVGVSCRRE